MRIDNRDLIERFIFVNDKIINDCIYMYWKMNFKIFFKIVEYYNWKYNRK